MTEDLNKKFNEFLNQAKKENSSLNYSHWKKFASKELIKLWEELNELCKKNNIEEFGLYRIIQDNYSPDLERDIKISLYETEAIRKNNLVGESYSEVKDSNFFIEIPKDSKINKDGFGYNDKFLIFDYPIRRNHNLTELLSQSIKNYDKVQVLIDPNIVGDIQHKIKTMLLSGWLGPQKIKDISEYSKEELIVKGPSFSDIPLSDKTEFYFKKVSNVWNLHIEELIPHFGGINIELEEKVLGKNRKFLTRYLHAVFNEDFSKCVHLDCYFKYYNTYEYFKARNGDSLDKILKKIENRHKILQIDAKEGILNYQDIIALFFIHNPYVVELFDGETDEVKEASTKRTKFLESEWNIKILKNED